MTTTAHRTMTMQLSDQQALDVLEQLLEQRGPAHLLRDFYNWKLQLMKLSEKQQGFAGLSPNDDYELRRTYDALNRLAIAVAGKGFLALAPQTRTTVAPPVAPAPAVPQTNAQRQYDIAISCAGDDTPYADQVAECLKEKGIRIFYYKFEQVALWGEDLYEVLDSIYRLQAHYCVMFLSEAYAHKLWTNHERKSAQARAFEENQAYILPVRFDDTAIPGVRPTVSYIDAADYTPQALCGLIIAKLQSTA